MRRIAQIISWLALAATVLPSVCFLTGQIDLALMQWMMLVATVVWFVATPLWMGRDSADGPLEDEIVVP